MLGVEKLNTTSYHPQCDGAVKRSIERSKQPSESMQHVLGVSGTNTCQESSGPTRTRPAVQLAKNPLFFSMAWIVSVTY